MVVSWLHRCHTVWPTLWHHLSYCTRSAFEEVYPWFFLSQDEPQTQNYASDQLMFFSESEVLATVSLCLQMWRNSCKGVHCLSRSTSNRSSSVSVLDSLQRHQAHMAWYLATSIASVYSGLDLLFALFEVLGLRNCIVWKRNSQGMLLCWMTLCLISTPCWIYPWSLSVICLLTLAIVSHHLCSSPG